MPTIKTLRMGMACYHVLHSVPPFAAHEMCLFQDEGLVDDLGDPVYEILQGGLTPFNAEKQALAQAMKEKGVSIAMDVKPSTVLHLNRRGADLRIIAGWRNQNHNWVMSRPEITEIGQLRNRVVGLKDFGSVRYFALVPLLQKAGLDPEIDVKFIRNVSDGAEALIHDQVDAAFVSPERGPEMESRGFTKLVDLAEVYKTGRPDRIIVATQQLLDERPDWAAAYVRGMIRGYWFIRTMPDNLRYIRALERRLRSQALDPDEHNIPFLACGTAERCEAMPFPIDGMITGLEEYVQAWVDSGDLEKEDAACLDESLRLDVAQDAFKDLMTRDELKPEYDRAAQVVARLGY